eukprot:3151578-Rhodomonas_salina.1
MQGSVSHIGLAATSRAKSKSRNCCPGTIGAEKVVNCLWSRLGGRGKKRISGQYGSTLRMPIGPDSELSHLKFMIPQQHGSSKLLNCYLPLHLLACYAALGFSRCTISSSDFCLPMHTPCHAD